MKKIRMKKWMILMPPPVAGGIRNGFLYEMQGKPFVVHDPPFTFVGFQDGDNFVSN